VFPKYLAWEARSAAGTSSQSSIAYPPDLEV
jgi:hypothetical protein